MKWFSRFFLLVLFSYLILVIYLNRSYYTSKFDESFWKDKYEHSQWKLPLSTRILGDDGLYLYESYRLINGADPTTFNAEVPPLGKYLIGLSILIFQNGHFFALIVNLLTVFVFYRLAKFLLEEKLLIFSVSLIFVFDPLFMSQFTLTMLDSLQLLFLLWFFLLLTKFNKTNSHKSAILLGIILGLFSQVKFPILTPFLFLLSGLYLWLKTKKIKTLFLFATSTFIFYLLPYAWYFKLGHNFTQWLGVQKWILTFYAQSKLLPNTGSAVSSLLFGKTQNLFTKTWEGVPLWNFTWTVSAILGSIGLLLNCFMVKKQTRWLPLTFFTMVIFILYFFIPFWTRYLLLLLPFLYLVTVDLLKFLPTKARIALVMLLAAGNVYSTFKILYPTPEEVMKQTVYSLKNGFFHDLYEELSDKDKNYFSRAQFHQIGLTAYYDAEIEAVDIELLRPDWQRFKSPQTVPLLITYKTRHLGSFSENKEVVLIRQNGRWRVVWDWNYLINGLSEQTRLETIVNEARRGSIILSNQTKISGDIESFLVWVTPNLVDKNREEEMLKFLEKLFSAKPKAVEIHQRYVGNSLPSQPVAIGVLPQKSDDDVLKKLNNFKGITLTKHLGRITERSEKVDVGALANTLYPECCSSLYTTTAYDGLSGVEKQQNSVLKGTNGGHLVIKDLKANTIRTIINREKIEGKDFQLNFPH